MKTKILTKHTHSHNNNSDSHIHTHTTHRQTHIKSFENLSLVFHCIVLRFVGIYCVVYPSYIQCTYSVVGIRYKKSMFPLSSKKYFFPYYVILKKYNHPLFPLFLLIDSRRETLHVCVRMTSSSKGCTVTIRRNKKNKSG